MTGTGQFPPPGRGDLSHFTGTVLAFWRTRAARRRLRAALIHGTDAEITAAREHLAAVKGTRS